MSAQDWFALACALLGGMGLLLMGMSTMTEGLKLASGNALRDALGLWTSSRLRGVLSGFLATAVTQSSTAVTLATVGFANAGMLNLERAVWVIYGSNVGTTLTTWVVALLGFQVDMDLLALPLAGLGALLHLSGGRTRRASIGLALFGFGLLFLGIEILKDAFVNVDSLFVFPAGDDLALPRILLIAAVGVGVTLLIQSSTAATLIALGAVESGLVPLEAAAAFVVGANLGTCGTAMLTVLWANANARRVALSHLFFNLLTAGVAVLILGQLLALVALMERGLGLGTSPATALALFHTVFNVLGVLLMWPLSGLLVRVLLRLFKERSELDTRPHYLDKALLGIPYLAVDAMSLEAKRLSGLASTVLKISLSPSRSGEAPEEEAVLRKLTGDLRDYAVDLSRGQLTPLLSELLAQLMECAQQYLLAVNIGEDIRGLDASAAYDDPLTRQALGEFLGSVHSHLDEQDLTRPAFAEAGSASYEAVESSYRRLKLRILKRAALGDFNMETVDRLLQYCNQVKRACRQMWKASQRLTSVQESLRRDAEGNLQSEAPRESEQLAKLKEGSQAGLGPEGLTAAEAEADPAAAEGNAPPSPRASSPAAASTAATTSTEA